MKRTIVPCILALGVAASSSAATLTVTATGSARAGDGVCSLREAIENANNDHLGAKLGVDRIRTRRGVGCVLEVDPQ